MSHVAAPESKNAFPLALEEAEMMIGTLKTGAPKEEAFPTIRLPATPQTTSGRPRASPTKKTKTTLDSLPQKEEDADEKQERGGRFEELRTWWEKRTRGQKMRTQAKAQFQGSKTAVQVWLSEFRADAKSKTSNFKVKVKALACNFRTKAQNIGTSIQAWGVAKTAGARAKAQELDATARPYLAGWREQVRQVGHWNHPAPLALVCFVAMVILFIGSSLSCVWPIAVHMTPRISSSFSPSSAGTTTGLVTEMVGNKPAAAPVSLIGVPKGIVEEEKVGDTKAEAKEVEMAITIENAKGGNDLVVKPVGPTPPEEEAGVIQKQQLHQYEENNRRYLAARAALQEHNFMGAHRILVGLANEGAMATKEMNWAGFGNFSRASFLTDLGSALVFTGQYHEAVPVLTTGLFTRPTGSGLNALGIAYRNLGDLESSIGAFEAAAQQFAPHNAKAWSNLGVLATELGRFQKADDAFYYAAEAAGLELDDTLVHNVQILHKRANGQATVGSEEQEEVASLELWYDENE